VQRTRCGVVQLLITIITAEVLEHDMQWVLDDVSSTGAHAYGGTIKISII
jgi:hypothetical protein